MANLPKALRSALAEAFELRWPEVAERALSFDGTRKYLFRLDDGATIEAVYIPEDDRRTICISTQAGCPLKCAFCLTGIAGYKRNLKTWEILGQVATRDGGAPGRRDPPAPARGGPLPLEHRGDGDGGAAPQLRGHGRGAAHPDGRGGLRRAAAQADPLHGGNPARAREAREGARPPEPRDQPPRPRPRPAPRADADRGEVLLRRGGRGRAALPDPARRARHLRVRAARRRERHRGARARARAAAGRPAREGEPHPPEPRAGDPVPGPDAGGRGRLRPDASPRPASRCPCGGRAVGTSSPPAGSSTSRRAPPRPPRRTPDDTGSSPPRASRPPSRSSRWASWRSCCRTSARRRSSGPRSTSSTPRARWSRAATGSIPRYEGQALLRQADPRPTG